MAGGLRSEMITFESLKMVHMKHPSTNEEEEAAGLQTLELSNLDLLYDYYNALALFYPVGAGATHNNGVHHDAHDGSAGAEATLLNGLHKHDPIHSINDPAKKLECALQELLVHYPAAAGRLHINQTSGRYEVKYRSAASSCSTDDEDVVYGLPFLVARANTAFSTLGDVSVPHPSLDVLYPCAPERNHHNQPPPPVVLIQVTTFTCGSFTLAFMSSHMLLDAYGAAVFLKNLCSIANGEGVSITMDMTNRREVMAPRVSSSPMTHHPHICTRKRGETPVKKELPYGDATRFSFDRASLETLRLRASGPHTKRCSRFQALIAVLWIIRAKCLSNSGLPPSLELPLRIPINMRGREISTLTQGYLGNAVFQCCVSATLVDLCESSLACVVQKIAASMLQGTHLQESMQSQVDYIESQLQIGHVPYVDHECLAVPCLVNLPFFDADCGWGCPIYCGRPSRQLGQRIIILDNPQTKGWNVLAVLSSQEEYTIFQQEIAKWNTA